MPHDHDDMQLNEFPDASDQSPIDMTHTVACSKCGKPVMEGSVCCPGCGKYMVWDEEEQGPGWIVILSVVLGVLLAAGLVWWIVQALI